MDRTEMASGTAPEGAEVGARSAPDGSDGRGQASSAASTTEKVQETAQAVKDEAMTQTRAVADTAMQQGRAVMADIGEQVNRQLGDSQNRLAQRLGELSQEFDQASAGGDGQVSSLAGEAAWRTRQAAQWLEQSSPTDVLEAISDFARRRPLTYLAACATAGLVFGRLTRGLVSAMKDDSDSRRAELNAPARPVMPATPEPGVLLPGGPAYPPTTVTAEQGVPDAESLAGPAMPAAESLGGTAMPQERSA